MTTRRSYRLVADPNSVRQIRGKTVVVVALVAADGDEITSEKVEQHSTASADKAAALFRQKMLDLGAKSPASIAVLAQRVVKAVNDAVETATSSNAQQTDHPYQATPEGLFWVRMTQAGVVDTQLTNFTARIVSDVLEDDGQDVTRLYEIDAALRGRTRRFTVSASQFNAMNWAVEKLGGMAIVSPGMGLRDHARAAIQHLSGQFDERHLYTHTGWREVGGLMVYLHAAGAIGPLGPVTVIETHLSETLARYRLPDPPSGAELVDAIHASLRVLEVADDRVTVPPYCAVWRAALPDVADMSVFLSGRTQVGKSELAALCQQHYGADMDRKHLPASWETTGNALGGMLYLAKDALLVIDDFAPAGNPLDIQRLQRDAAKVFRSQGNLQGRGRMRADTQLRNARPPRGLVLATGEEVPRGQSLRGRLFIVDVADGAIDFRALGACQRDAASGLYAQVFAGYVRWVAAGYAAAHASLKARFLELREQAARTGHRRAPEMVANLYLGAEHFVRFAQQTGALSEQQAAELLARIWAALQVVETEQAQYQDVSEPTRRFLELLVSAVGSGGAHLASADGSAPDEPQAWGWREHTYGEQTSWQPHGPRIGWLEGDDLYLNSNAAYAAAQKAGINDGVEVSVQTLKKRLHERRLLASVEVRGGVVHLEVRKMLEGQRRPVLHVHIHALHTGEESGPSGPTGPSQASPSSASAANGQVSWATSGPRRAKVAHKSGPIEAEPEFEPEVNGPVGQVGPLITPHTPPIHNTPGDDGEDF